MAAKEFVFYCYEIDSDKCCSSCHDEWNEGYGDPFDWRVGKSVFYTCCRWGVSADQRQTAFEWILLARKFRSSQTNDRHNKGEV